MNQSPPRKPRRRILQRFSIALLVVLAAGYSTVNVAARLVLENQLSSALQCDVDIGSVRVGWLAATIRDIRLASGNSSDEPLLEVPHVRVSLTLGDGFRHGIWADKVVVTNPKLTLSVSKSGELLTDFPRPSPGSDGPAPLRLLKIVGGTVDVKQHDGTTFRIYQTTAILKVNERLRFAAVVPELFGGELRVKADLDANSLAGHVRISARGLQGSSTKLRALPIIGAHIPDVTTRAGALNRFAASGSLEMSIAVPPNPGSLLACAAEAEVAIDFVDLPGRGVRADNIVVGVSHKAGRPATMVADADVCGGRVHLDGELRLPDALGDIKQPIRGHLNCSVDELPLESIARRLDLPGPTSAELNAQGALSISLLQDRVTLDGSLKSIVTNINVVGIRSAPLTVMASVNGEGDIVDAGFQPAEGQITASLQTNGANITNVVASVLPVLQSETFAPKIEPLIQRLRSWESGGRVSLFAELNAPLQAVKNIRLVRASGRLMAEKVSLAGFATPEAVVSLHVLDGVASVQLPETRVLDLAVRHLSTLSGQCTLPFALSEQAIAEFSVENLSLAGGAAVAGLEPRSIAGTLSARMKVAAPMHRISDSASWQGHGVVLSPLFFVHGEPITEGQLRWSLANNQIQVPYVSARWNQTSLTAEAAGEIVSPFRFAGNMAVVDVDLSEVSRLAESLTGARCQVYGLAACNGAFHGEAASMHFQCGGDVTLKNVSIADNRLGDHRFRYALSPTLVHIEEKDAGFFGGDASLTATLSRGSMQIRHIAGQFQNVRLRSLADVLAINESVAGALDGDLVIAEPMLPKQLSGRYSLRSRDAQIAGIPVETFNTSIVANSGKFTATLRARAIGAECEASAQANIIDVMTASPEILSDPRRLPISGQLALSDLSVERLRRVAAAQPGRIRIPPELSGLLELRLNRTADTAAGGALLAGDATVRHLLWDQVLWSKDVVARFQVMPDAVELKEVVGTFADGRVSGRGFATFAGNPDGQFRLSLSRMNLRKATVPVRELAGNVTGVADLQIEGRLGRRISGRATLSVDRASVQGVSFSHARFPVDWSAVPSTRDIQIESHSIAMNVGGGRVHGEATARWNGRLDLNASAIAQHVDTRKLMANGGGAGGGTLDGTIQLRARGARSINDVAGRFEGTLKDAQAMKMPVLDQTARLLGSLSRSTSFKDGTVKGRLANGVITLEQLNLMASNVRIVMDGTATLRGNLNLFVSAYTSETGPADRILDFADSPIMLAAPAPVAIVAKINDALKDRTIHVNVGGTVGQPLVRLQPGRQLQQEALQFLVNSSLSFSPIKPIQTVGHTR